MDTWGGKKPYWTLVDNYIEAEIGPVYMAVTARSEDKQLWVKGVRKREQAT